MYGAFGKIFVRSVWKIFVRRVLQGPNWSELARLPLLMMVLVLLVRLVCMFFLLCWCNRVLVVLMLLVLMAVAGSASGARVAYGTSGAGNPDDAKWCGAVLCSACPFPPLAIQKPSIVINKSTA